MKYLRKFHTSDDVFMVIKPNVVLVEDTKSVLYNTVNLGVFIQHIDNSLYTTSQWVTRGFKNSEANGVAIIDEQACFTIAKDKKTGALLSESLTLEGILTTTDRSDAMTDFNGKNNTEILLATGKSPGATVATNYTFPNGKHGYIGSLGEWSLVAKYHDEVIAAMKQIGGTTQYWYHNRASTLYNNTESWGYNMSSSGSYFNESCTIKVAIRPFCSIDL